MAARRSAVETATAGSRERAGVVVYLAVNFYTPGWYADRPSRLPQLIRGSTVAMGAGRVARDEKGRRRRRREKGEGYDRGSIYRNGDLYIARRELCIASTHPGHQSFLPSPPALNWFPSPQSLRRPPTPTSRAHRSALRMFAGGNVPGCARGVRGGWRGVSRAPTYGTDGMVLYAVRAGSMKPGHQHPLRARGARETSLTFEMHPSIQLSRPGSQRYVLRAQERRCDFSVAAFFRLSVNRLVRMYPSPKEIGSEL